MSSANPACTAECKKTPCNCGDKCGCADGCECQTCKRDGRLLALLNARRLHATVVTRADVATAANVRLASVTLALLNARRLHATVATRADVPTDANVRPASVTLALLNARRLHAAVETGANVPTAAGVRPVQRPASVVILASVERAAREPPAASVLSSAPASEARDTMCAVYG
ncbi:hypothetical protein C0Q70_16532 [Pomacea canaliculata]|uniref:Uncharacterized protein n=1 Tax=Pomacea canaliculata TaxID=400727 RepID=A0A2T7NQ22_POMCA|nr:hypothetical protein C0Q70_16532 [Pomacea canaliculata]